MVDSQTRSLMLIARQQTFYHSVKDYLCVFDSLDCQEVDYHVETIHEDVTEQ